MHKQRTRRLSVVALLAVAAGFPTPPDVANPFARECEVVGFSPDFSKDQTVFCVANEYAASDGMPTGNLIFKRSVDGGATWEDLVAAGLQGLGLAFPSQLIVSPEYGQDATVYVQVVYGSNPGIYRSTDGGATFANVAPLARTGYTRRALTSFLMPHELVPEPLGAGREALAYATNEERRPALVTPPLHEPVVGAPGITEVFVLPSDFPTTSGYAVAGRSAPGSAPTAPEPLYSVYRCDASLSCLVKVHDFPAGWSLKDARMLPDSRPYFVMASHDNPKVLRVWRANEEGIDEWSGLNQRLPDISDAPVAFPSVTITAAADSPRRLFARVSFVLSTFTKGPPTDQVFASDDGGATWRRMSFGRGVSQPGPRGTIPWHLRAGPPHSQGDIYAPSGDRLMVVAHRLNGDGSNMVGAFCSFDGARTWSDACRP